MKLKVILLSMTLTFFTNISFGVTQVATGKVSTVYTYGNGMVLVTGISFPGSSCNNSGGFFISGSHPDLQTFLSTILMAKVTQSELTVVAKTDDCWYPEIVESGETTYIILN